MLVLDQTNTLGFAALVDPLRAANRQAGRSLYTWEFATPEDRPVALTSGVVLPAHPIVRVAYCDMLLVVASFDVARQATPALSASLRRLGKRARVVGGVDGGPWVLAQAGLLDGHQATTHWEDLDAFAQAFDRVETVNARYVTAPSRMTSAGAAPTVEMMIARIAQDHGQALADKVAGSLLMDHTLPQPRRQLRHPLPAQVGSTVARAHDLMESTLDAPLPVAEVAAQVGLSPRGLQQQFQQMLGVTPQAHFLALRLEEAMRLVTQTPLPLHHIALETGFASQSSFARAFKRAFGQSARGLRKAAQARHQ